MKKCVVVLGIARSGTSALAGTLNILGVYFGNKLKPADKWNPKGNFEHNDLSLANQAILKTMNSNWCDENELPDNWWDNHDVLVIKEHMKKIIIQDFNEVKLFGIKDPRITILLPIYIMLFREINVQPYFIATERDEKEVAESIRSSPYLFGKYSFERIQKLYNKYKQSMDHYTSGYPFYVISFNELLSNPEKSINQLNKYSGIPTLKQFDAVKKEISDFLDIHLKHYR